MTEVSVDMRLNTAKIIEFIIKNQAGTLLKGVMECLQNSFDARAKNITISVDEDNMLVITDDGIGISQEQMLDSFATFGDSIKPDGDCIGKFGIGRGQIFNFGPTTYRSSTVLAKIDLSKGYKIDYEIDLPPVQGTEVTVMLNESGINWLNEHSLLSELEAHVFVPGTKIMINDEEVKYSTEEEILIFEDFRAYKRKHSWDYGIYVYNRGIFVTETSRSVKGSYSITATTLNLNMSRNMIIEDDEYKRLKVFENMLNKKIIEEHDLSQPLTCDHRLIYSAGIDNERMKKLKFLRRKSDGVYISLSEISGPVYKISGSSKHLIDAIQTETNGVVIDFDSGDEQFLSFNSVDVVDGDDYTSSTLHGNQIPRSDLNMEELKMFMKLEKINAFIGNYRASRELRPMRGATCYARTDGGSYITIEIGIFMSIWKESRVKFFLTAVETLVHEYSHTDEEEASHGTQFYSRYNTIMQEILPEVYTQL